MLVIDDQNSTGVEESFSEAFRNHAFRTGRLCRQGVYVGHGATLDSSDGVKVDVEVCDVYGGNKQKMTVVRRCNCRSWRYLILHRRGYGGSRSGLAGVWP